MVFYFLSIYFPLLLFFLQIKKKFHPAERILLAVGECLDDADLVCDVKSIVIASKTHVRLLLAVGSDETIHLGHLDVVELADCGADVVLVGAEMNLEY